MFNPFLAHNWRLYFAIGVAITVLSLVPYMPYQMALEMALLVWIQAVKQGVMAVLTLVALIEVVRRSMF